MKPVLIGAAALLSLTLGGCVVAVDGPGPGGPRVEVCSAEAASFVIGRRATEGQVQRAVRASGARVARVVRPGEVYTQEFRPDRLTIRVDRRNRIVDLSCG